VIARQLRACGNLGRHHQSSTFIDIGEPATIVPPVLAEAHSALDRGPHAAVRERLHAAGLGRDDAQAHAENRSLTCCASPAPRATAAAS